MRTPSSQNMVGSIRLGDLTMDHQQVEATNTASDPVQNTSRPPVKDTSDPPDNTQIDMTTPRDDVPPTGYIPAYDNQFNRPRPTPLRLRYAPTDAQYHTRPPFMYPDGTPEPMGPMNYPPPPPPMYHGKANSGRRPWRMMPRPYGNHPGLPPPPHMSGDYGPVDMYGQPMPGYSPAMYGGFYGPPTTPHGFHDGYAEDMYPPFPPHMGSHMADMAMPGYPGPGGYPVGYPPMGMNQRPPPEFDQPYSPIVEHIRSHFNNENLADCYLDVRQGGHQVLLIPAHRMIIAQSDALAELLTQGTNNLGVISRITVKLDAKYARPDAFMYALQHLYGYELFQIPPPMSSGGPTSPCSDSASGSLMAAGSAVAQFNFALGYASAGKTLNLPAVRLRGAQIAGSLINWDTVESALAFTLADESLGAFIQSPEQLPEAEHCLMRGVLRFLINMFPTEFKLDNQVGDGIGWGRLPMALPVDFYEESEDEKKESREAPVRVKSPPTPPTSSHAATGPTNLEDESKRVSIVRPKGEKRFSNVLNIRFGDFTLGEEVTPATSPKGSEAKVEVDGEKETEKETVPEVLPSPPHFKTLSQILINLPHFLLKEVLESATQECHAGAPTAMARMELVKRVIEEREKRRSGMIKAILKSGMTEDKKGILARLGSYNGLMGESWDVLCWREMVDFDDGWFEICWRWEGIEGFRDSTGFGMFP